ncbi:trigger factor [Ignatzschineria sp. RMDPL8A]|uniref:trigger factor n=1 Tax=Ignatzschineria sp. RMDPL8A TaxID=2999236 RepID=UPI0024466258|nr:trigger factor [Ignatzschineria sp. RMDPL8A]MDG9730247.1 trigger factor [Ignatzschineria sp. RMDPL8A]
MSTIETLEGLKRHTVIELDQAAVQAEVKTRLKDLSKRIRLDGFRPGKVPVSVVQKMHGDQVKYEVINDQIGQAYRAFLEENKDLKTAGYPEISVVEGEEYKFNVNFEVMPEFELQGLDGLKATKIEAEVKDEDLDLMLERLQKQQSKWNVVERAAANDDRVKIDFVGRVDGEEFEGGKGTDVPLVLGSGSMIPGFEDQIVGLSTGDTKTIEVTFPEEYHSENLKGKAAEFDITVNEVAEMELPAIDEEFAKNLGIEDGKVESLRAELKKNMERELKSALQNSFKNSMMESLAAANEIEVPNALVNAEVQNMARQSNFPEAQNQEQAAQLMEIAMSSFGEEAKKRARLGLLIAKVIEDNKIELDDKYVEARLNMLAETYEDPEEVLAYFRSNEENMRQIQNIALEDQIVDVLAEKAEIVTEEKAFQDVMNASFQ